METLQQFIAARFTSLPPWAVLGAAMLGAIGFLLAVFPGVFAFITWVERKALGRVQNRYGPNRVGPLGLFQPLADGLKLLTKEDIIPRAADKWVHTLAPILAVVPALMVLIVLPVAKGFVPVNLSIGILFAFAISTASVLSLFMAGWASRNKFSLLGAMRGVAQVVSYEIPMVMAAVVVVMAVGSLSTVDIVESQKGIFGWHVLKPWGFVGFVLFTIGAMAESARTPFDIPEAESEIIAGYHTEYSGFKFALFQMGEYLAAMAMAGISVTMFLGGYYGPGYDLPVVGGIISFGWFMGKFACLIALNIWIRGTWPRIRVDQLLTFAWKVLLPMSLINIVAMAIWHFVPSKPVGWVASAVVLVVSFLVLTRLSGGRAMEKRVYRYAE